MKKITRHLFIILLILSFSALQHSGIFAQKASVSKAYNLFFDKDFVRAKEVIDLCVLDEKLSQKAQTWLYKANIYFYLSSQEFDAKREDNLYQTLFPDAAEQAFDAFQKAKEMNKNVEAFDMLSPSEGIPKLCALLLVYGVDELISGDYHAAKRILEKARVSYEFVKPPLLSLNGELYYYYAYSLEMLNEIDKANEFYKKSITDGSNNVNVYLRLIENYKKEKNHDKIKEILEAGKKTLLNNPALYVAEIDYFFLIDNKKNAHTLMENIPPEVFENADLLVNVANFYILENDYSKANELLIRANQLMPNNFVVLYNLGVCVYYLSEENFKIANELEVKGDKGNAMIYKTKSDNYLLEAQNFFERVYRTEPHDVNVIYTLRSIYARLQSPKYDEIDAIIKGMENK